MTSQEAKELVRKTFKRIKNSKSISEIDEILTWASISKNLMSDKSYPKIEFKIEKWEIEELKSKSILKKDNSISPDVWRMPMDALTKLLYALSWKNGDLTKISHIVEGIISGESRERKTGLVFYQFGKYLTKKPGEPIVDQHVLRAFGIYRLRDLEQVESIRKMAVITKKEEKLIECYKSWKKSSELKDELKKEIDYSHHIDKVLFAVGKTIKLNKPTSVKLSII